MDELDLAILRGQQEFHANGCKTWPDYSGWPHKVVVRRMEKLEAEGFLGYGVSLRTAWVTDRGIERIAVLRGIIAKESNGLP